MSSREAMKWFVNRKKNLPARVHFARGFKLAALVTAVVFGTLVTGVAVGTFARPIVSTGYYHANIQFRAGNEASYDAIFRQSLQHIVTMYDRHPTWRWTLECQGLLIEMANQSYPDVYAKIWAQNRRGQLELVCPQYSHGLAVAYPYKDFAESVAFNKALLEGQYGLTVSDVIVLQEGQWLPAFGQVAHLGFDTMVVSRDQLAYHNYFPREPILRWDYGGVSAHVMPVPWIPLVEAGVFHHQLALSDSERINTGDIEGPHEFNYNPDKMAQVEARHVELERLGNQFLTLSEWKDYCLARGHVEAMTRYQPESHWTPNRHQSVSRWMAWGTRGSSDDGQVHARNYYTRNHLFAAQVLLETSAPSLAPGTRAALNASLSTGFQHLWLAQVTDTSGVNPHDYELAYAVNHTREAQAHADAVIAGVKAARGWAGQPIQVQCWNREVLTDPATFATTGPPVPGTVAELEARYGFTLTIARGPTGTVTATTATTATATTATAPQLVTPEVWRETWTARVNGTPRSFTYDVVRATFPGRTNFTITNSLPALPALNYTGPTTSQRVTFRDDWSRATYSPSLLENATQELGRADYRPPGVGADPDYIVPLPIANGLLYNPAGGYGIITRNVVRHLSVKWETSHVAYYETDQDFNATYEFLLTNASLAEAHLLANLVNAYPTVEV